MKHKIEGGKWCVRCERLKPHEAFGFLSDGRTRSYCKTCQRLLMTLKRQTEEYRVWRAEYMKRPEVRDRRRAYNREYTKRLIARESRRKWRQSTKGKLSISRTMYKIRLKNAKTEERRRYLQELISMCDREIARIDQQKGMQS